MVKRPGGRQVQAAFQDLSTCNISDALDRLGLSGQVTGILPLWQDCPKVAGPAKTMKLSPQATYSTTIGTLEAIQTSRPGDVLVIANDGRLEINSFGGIATFSARHLHIQGCVIDGATRDVDEMADLRFPVYGKGVVNVSVRGRTGFDGYDLDVQLGGVDVRPGDYVFGDRNGIVVVAYEAITDVLRWARRFNGMEQRIKREIAAGTGPVPAHRRHRYEEASRKPS